MFDALNRKYLECCILEIYEEIRKPSAPGAQDSIPLETQEGESDAPDPSEGAGDTTRRILEVFSFSVEYPNQSSGPEFTMARGNRVGKGKAKMDPAITRSGLTRSTSEVLRQLVELASTLAPLPKNRVVSMKLLYTSVTPEDYEPPMFRAADEASTSCWFENRPLKLSPGKVRTPYHEMLIRIRTAVDTLDPKESDLMAVDSPQPMCDASPQKQDDIEEDSETNSPVIDVKNEAGEGDTNDADSFDEIDDDESDLVEGVQSPKLPVNIGKTFPKTKENAPSSNSTERHKITQRTDQQGLNSSMEKAAQEVGMLSLSQGQFQGSQRQKSSQIRLKEAPQVSAANRQPQGPSPAQRLTPTAIGSKRTLEAAEQQSQGQTTSPFGVKRPPLPQKRRSSVDKADSQATTQLGRSSRRKVSETEDRIYQRPKRLRRGASRHHTQKTEEGLWNGGPNMPDDDIVSSCI